MSIKYPLPFSVPGDTFPFEGLSLSYQDKLLPWSDVDWSNG